MKQVRVSFMMIGATVLLLTLGVLSTPALADRQKGVVKWFNAQKGYGFLTYGGGPDRGIPEIFVPASALSGSCNGTLHEGQAVEFDIQVEPKMGRKSAKDVTCR